MTFQAPSLLLSMIEETKATDAEIDAFATRILETMSPPETSFIDDSLGPYVTSLLRCADIRDKYQVTTLAEFDSILELLEDQCSMDQRKASDCVMLIAEAVITNVLPELEISATMNGGIKSNFSLYTQQGVGKCPFQSMISDLPNHVETIRTEPTTTLLSRIVGRTDNSIPIAGGGLYPLKPDNLIPIDLMGELDDPSPEYSSPLMSALHVQCDTHQQQYPQIHIDSDDYAHDSNQSPKINGGRSKHDHDFPPLGTSPEAFPPLRASIEKPKKARIGSSKKSLHGKSQQHSDRDLAATLFRPARPRQNSIESEDVASRSRGSSNASPSMTTITSTIDEGSGIYNNINNAYFQQQLNSCVEILLSMNQELSEEAASAAGLTANTDFNLAQHVIDSAMSAPPICRHMLQDGCYRSDCTFSHDLEGHTCLFWLRGRCGKGSSCKFFHGFHEKLLNGIDTSKYQLEQHSSNRGQSPGYQQLHPLNYSSSPTTSPSLTVFSSTLNSGFGGTFSPLLSSSWQTGPSLEGTYGGSVSSMPSKLSSSSKNAPFSFANIASKGYEKNKFSEAASLPSFSTKCRPSKDQIPTVRIPQDLWNAHENRDSSAFYVSDPLERYQKIAASVHRSDVIDLHFQSIKTFPIVLETVLPLKMNKSEANCHQVWIVTGTGHHVGSKTHQKGGGALESAVIAWLTEHDYKFARGKDRNGLSGALLVKRCIA